MIFKSISNTKDVWECTKIIKKIVPKRVAKIKQGLNQINCIYNMALVLKDMEELWPKFIHIFKNTSYMV